MNSPAHQFKTPHARELFAMGAELLIEGYSNKPVTLPTASPKAIREEIDRLERVKKREHRGTPGEL